jgi:gliding motility-associated-like protein
MHRKRLCLYVILVWCCTAPAFLVCAQQGNTWYFGNFSGLSFNATPPTPLSNGQLNTFEGSSSISNENGDILFYTDGTTVFNWEHEVMLNGDNLLGHWSSYQSVIIVPKPGDKNIYYVFTSDAWENDGDNGYCYSEIDMRLDNGRGAVTRKNVFLTGPSSERLTAIRGADNSSYWVITNEWGSNIFRSYKVDCNGVNATPVTSVTGKVMSENTYCNIGTLRVSPNGKTLVQTNVKGRATASPGNEYAQIFDFDASTGIISNPRLMELTNDGYYFGAEFSPDSRLLYMVNPFKNSVHQFNVSSGDLLTIMDSKKVLTGVQGSLAGISMGPDLKLYITNGQPDLHVINQPNNSGDACNLVLRQQPLLGTANLCLPNVIPSLYVNRPVDFTFQLINCDGDVQFNTSLQIPGLQLQWDFGDGKQGTGPSPMHHYDDPAGEYLVKLTVTNSLNCMHEIVGKRLRPSGQGLTAGFGARTVCDSLRVYLSDSSETNLAGTRYSWDFGDGSRAVNVTDPVHQYSAYGTYAIQLIISNPSSCARDTFTRVVDFKKPVISAGADIEVTTIDPIALFATGGSKYQWKPATYLDNPNSATPVMKARRDITYVLTGFNQQGCSSTDTLNVTLAKMQIIVVPNAFRPSGTKNNLLRPLLREIKSLDNFQVYNRWGQMVFSTKTIDDGWDGTINGVPQPSGAYVWMLEVTDLQGNVVRKRGSSVLIR